MIQILDNPESMSEAAARLFARQSEQKTHSQGRFSVALSGGHTPELTYGLLARPPWHDQIPWEHIHIFWGDERCVPPDDPRSNARMAHTTLLDRVPIPTAQIHPIRCTHQPQQAAVEYEALLRGFFADGPPRFDLIFLGLGANGHTASIFPGTAAVDEQKRWVTKVYVAEQQMYRVTLTASLINQAAAVVFLVSGAAKAEILRRVIEGPYMPHDLPAQLIQPREGMLCWLVDKEAGGELGQEIGQADRSCLEMGGNI